MFALYLTCLTLAAGVVGLFFRQALQHEGYVPGLHAGLALTLGAASIYISLQLAYMAAVQLLKPTRGPGTLFADFLSQLAVLILIPFLIGLNVPWPHDLLTQLEPLVYFGVFAVVHGFFKLMTFFAAMRAVPAGRLRFALWFLGSVIGLSLSFILFAYWADDVRQLRPTLAPTHTAHAVNGVYGFATAVPEGAALSTPLEASDPAAVTLRIAFPAADPAPDPAAVYLDVYLHGRRTTRYSTTLRRPSPEQGWILVRIPPDFMPPDLSRCEIVWSSREESRLRKLIGIRPIQTSSAKLLVAGPDVHDARADSVQPSFVIVSAEGLSAGHMGVLGYERKTTRFLDRFAAQSVAFSNAYTTSPDAVPATFSVLTGRDSIAHSRRTADPEAADVETLAARLRAQGYATAIFTESGNSKISPFAFDGDIPRDFEYVDVAYTAEDADDGTMGGSKPTLERARAWIEQNSDVKFFVFVRVHELSAPAIHPRYGAGLTKNLDKTPPPKDIYDSALAYLDGHLGAFLKYIRDHETRKFTCTTVLSPFGIDFIAENGKPSVGLTENALRVPLLIQAPGLAAEKRDGLVSLAQVTPTLLELAGLEPSEQSAYASVLDENYEVDPVSIAGDPLEMALRKERWLFVWQSGLSATTLEPVAPDKVAGLYQITRRKSGYTLRDATARNSKLVQTYREQLMTYAGVQPPDETQGEQAMTADE